MATRYGTNHFATWGSAFRYYAKLRFTDKDVIRKVDDGEIAIGRPKHKPEETAVIDEDGRYYIKQKDQTDVTNDS
jgi:hypothetical protein